MNEMLLIRENVRRVSLLHIILSRVKIFWLIVRSIRYEFCAQTKNYISCEVFFYFFSEAIRFIESMWLLFGLLEKNAISDDNS